MVAPREVLTLGSLCLGIAGLDLGLEMAGFTTVWASEIDDTRRAWGRRNFPHTLFYGDINELLLLGSPFPVDAVVGGPPCQPASVAGERRGEADDRWLWPETLAVVAQVRPLGCLFENPPGLISLGLDRVLSDLEGLGYSGRPVVVPAVAVGSPQLRERVFIVGYADEAGLPIPQQQGKPSQKERWEQARAAASQRGCPPPPWGDSWTLCLDGKHRLLPPPESGICPVAHGVPGRVAEIKGYGDAVVPRLAYEVGLAFKAGLLEMMP